MIAFISNINIEPLGEYFKGEETYFAGFSQYTRELLDKDGELYSKKINTVFLFIDGEEFLKNLLYEKPMSKDLLYESNSRIAELMKIVKKYISRRNDVLFFMNSIVLPANSINAYVKNAEVSLYDVEMLLNKRIREIAKRIPNILILDWQMIVRGMGYYNLHDDKFWYLGRIKLNKKAFSLLAEHYRNLTNAHHGKSKKVLVLDLDNTLWGGIIGEDGIDGIQLSEDGQGKIFRDFQTLIKSLKQMGILLCINSKNNADDVNAVFANHPMMILKSNDFIIKKTNWSDKVQNMKEIAQELDLDVDSFVFIDESPAEREYVKKNLPAITVPEFPYDIATLKVWFFESIAYKYFARTFIAKEDLNKTEQYKVKLQRDTLSTNLSLNEFVANLEIKLKIYLNSTTYTQRIAQLTQKTNQFNFTTKRYNELEIEKYIKDDNTLVIGLEYEDKFGKEGLIGVSIIKTNAAEHSADLDTFLLSCRVIGKNVEYAFLNEILRILQQMKLSQIKIDFQPTKKNVVAKTFYDSFQLGTQPCSTASLINVLENKLLTSQVEIL